MLEASKDQKANSFGICCHKLPWPIAMNTWSKLMRWNNRKNFMELTQNLHVSYYRISCWILKLYLPTKRKIMEDHDHIYFCIWKYRLCQGRQALKIKSKQANKQITTTLNYAVFKNMLCSAHAEPFRTFIYSKQHLPSSSWCSLGLVLPKLCSESAALPNPFCFT